MNLEEIFTREKQWKQATKIYNQSSSKMGSFLFLKIPVLTLTPNTSPVDVPLVTAMLKNSYLLFLKHISFSQYLHCIDMACIFLLDQPHLECKNYSTNFCHCYLFRGEWAPLKESSAVVYYLLVILEILLKLHYFNTHLTHYTTYI